jgi:hypothetical protein
VEHAQKQREARGIHSRDSSPGIIFIDTFHTISGKWAV